MIEHLTKPYFKQYTRDVYGVQFSCMKVLPALYVVDRALKGEHARRVSLDSDGENSGAKSAPAKDINSFWESTSGTAGLGLALAVKHRSTKEFPLRLGLVGDQGIEPNRRMELKAFGADLHLVSPEAIAEAGSVQRARLNMLNRLLNEDGDRAYWTRQYDNEQWKLAYYAVAAECVRKLGRIDILVCGTGSGASSAGLFEGVRLAYPDVRLVGVDAIGSVLFDAPELPRGRMRGIGMGIKPKNLRSEYFSEVHWVSDRFAWSTANEMIREHGVSAGPTTGAAYRVARYVSEREPGKRVVFLGPDDARRYEPMIYDQDLLANENLLLGPDGTKAPREAKAPSEVCFDSDWWTINWRAFRENSEVGS